MNAAVRDIKGDSAAAYATLYTRFMSYSWQRYFKNLTHEINHMHALPTTHKVPEL